ncbi:hypothetical protein Nwi_1783 [Nitrobacter winogradskyi Nb-255]|uniref:Uncharacterized protein n=1 Tax=Nitrobacter winogradskyi (strain ATCC 25391 / DSM 10237 / CIP 104748 / NCIMB 11846 / Nb-255) TaxID=323098 RepID=Q3SRP7_NITWN|nr:hypothetical protein [Nitrobacter winogradskyi]ABA05044.1 hypothetical protein Nwi_1783 [Nitrobacter winogradskyi Nb-255]
MDNEKKIKAVLMVILIIATLLGLNALIAAVQKTGNKETHTGSVLQQELTLHGEKIANA